MAAAAAAANGSATVAAAEVRLTEELKAQFKEQINVLAVRVPKQSTHQYQKQLAK